MSAVGEALEALGLAPGGLPEPRLLADLFVRFQAQVPLRAAPAGRAPEEHLAAWLEDGAGLCGSSRVAAFEALALASGFRLERRVARGARGAHPVLLADERRLLLDPALPLAAPLALDPPTEAAACGYGTLSVRGGRDGAAELHLETRGEERLIYRIEAADGRSDEDPGANEGRAGREERADSRRATLFRLHDDRLLRWSDGVLEVSDSWSRLRVPFPASDADGLEALFGPPIEVAAGAGTPAAIEPTLAVYHASEAPPDRLRELLADPEAHAALLPEGWRADPRAASPDGFERTLLEDDRVLRREKGTVVPGGLLVEADGPLALFRTRTWRLEPRPIGTRLRLLATFRDPVPPRGLPDATRRRLVFELASELLALDRLAADA